MPVKRTTSRVGLEVLVTVVAGDGLPHLGKSSNVSPTGMLLEIAEPLEIGEKVRLKLVIPGTRNRLELGGEVTRDAGTVDANHSYGVRFTAVPKEHADEIGRFLSVRLQRQGAKSST